MAYFRCEKSTKILKKLLWNNPSPTTQFNAQTISLDLSKYEGVIIRCAWFITDLQLQYQLFNYVTKDNIAHNIASFLDYNTTNFYRGRFVTVTDSGVTFSNAGYPISTLANTDNRYVIPTEIYGYVYEPDMGEVDKRKFIVKDGFFMSGIDDSIKGTPSIIPGNDYFTFALNASYSSNGVGVKITNETKQKYKRMTVVAFPVVNPVGFRFYTSPTETGTQTLYGDQGLYTCYINSVGNDYYLWAMFGGSGGTVGVKDVYLE